MYTKTNYHYSKAPSMLPTMISGDEFALIYYLSCKDFNAWNKPESSGLKCVAEELGKEMNSTPYAIRKSLIGLENKGFISNIGNRTNDRSFVINYYRIIDECLKKEVKTSSESHVMNERQAKPKQEKNPEKTQNGQEDVGEILRTKDGVEYIHTKDGNLPVNVAVDCAKNLSDNWKRYVIPTDNLAKEKCNCCKDTLVKALELAGGVLRNPGEVMINGEPNKLPVYDFSDKLKSKAQLEFERKEAERKVRCVEYIRNAMLGNPDADSNTVYSERPDFMKYDSQTFVCATMVHLAREEGIPFKPSREDLSETYYYDNQI